MPSLSHQIIGNLMSLSVFSLPSPDLYHKQNLVHAYHILAHLGLDDHTYTHLSIRSEQGDAFYIYPFGLRFEEVEPDSLMKISLMGEILEGEEYQYNRTGYIIHGHIYQARPDIQAVFHLHTPEIAAVSAYGPGLLPLSQWALHFYEQMVYHTYDSLALHLDQGSQLTRDLGDKFSMLLRNHGSLTCGRTIQEALFYTYHLYQACKTQCLLLSMAKEANSIVSIPPHVCEKAVKDLLSFEKNLGERDWNAWIRFLDRK